MRLRLSLVALSCWLFACPAALASAQTEPWSRLTGTVFEHLGVSSGLPNSVVLSLAQDREGFLWVGTASGVARWDGYRFHVYGADVGETGLPDNFIERLHADSQGVIWAGLSAGGLARYDQASDRFIPVPLDARSPSRVANAIADDGANGLWIGTDAGLEHLGPGENAAIRVVPSAKEGDGLPNQPVKSLLRDRAGNLWVGTSEGLYRRDQGFARFTPVLLPGTKTAILALLEDGEGKLWIGTSTQGAFLLGRGESTVQAVHESGMAKPGIEVQRVVAITEVSPGQIWFSTDGQGIVALETATGRTRRLQHDQAQSTSLQHDEVAALFRDRSGQIWIGTVAGLDRCDPSQTAISTVFGGSGDGTGLTKPDVRSVLTFDDKQIWLGLGDEGIDVVMPAESRLSYLHPGAAGSASLPHDLVPALAKSPDGSVYAGTRRGLFRVSGANRSIVRVPLSADQPEMDVGALLVQGKVLWIGTRNNGLWSYVEGSGGRPVGLGRLTDPRVRTLAPAPDGRLWVGTRNGLNLVDPATEEVEQSLPDPQNPGSLSAGLVSSLMTDRQGRLWVSTEGGGIDLLEGRDASGHMRFRRFGTAEGLPHANVNKLLMDRSGKIWASTDDGLVSIDPDSFAIRSFRRAEGVAIPAYWINSGDVTEQGDLLFGGVGGLAVVHPDRVTEWRYIPPVVVTDLRVGGKTVPAGLFTGGARKPVVIQPEANSIAVEFAALDFSSPERNRYAYKLEGFDKDWVETDSSRRLASYTNLKPGTYMLRLRGSNRDGMWAETSLDLPLRVLPAWYQTLWFQAVMVMLGASVIVLIVRSRTAYYRKQQQILERRVELRTRELNSKSSQLKALLDNSGQGFLSFGTDLVIDGEYSLACETMLGMVPVGMTADRALFSAEEKKAELFRKTAEAIRECKDFKRRNVMITLFPKEIRRGELMIDATYRRIDDGRLMAILTDVTDARRLAEKLEANYRRQDMVVAAVTQSRDFFETVENYRSFLETELPQWLARPEMSDEDLSKMFRTVHTFKGVLSQFSFERSPEALHELEEVLSDFANAEGGETMEMLRDVVNLGHYHRALGFDIAVIEGLLGKEFVENGARIAIPADKAENFALLAKRLLADETVDAADRDLLRELSRIHYVALDRVLKGYDRVVRQVAEAQGKAVAPLAVEGGEGILVDPRRYHAFFQALVHVFRNAVSHGIETPDARVDAGKDEGGTILCRVRQGTGSVVLTIADDGAGIDMDRLRAKMAEVAVPVQGSDEATMQTVFLDRISTRTQADEFSGRGVGLAAVWQAVEALGGSASVSSVPGEGTVFSFTLPLDEDV